MPAPQRERVGGEDGPWKAKMTATSAGLVLFIASEDGRLLADPAARDSRIQTQKSPPGGPVVFVDRRYGHTARPARGASFWVLEKPWCTVQYITDLPIV